MMKRNWIAISLIASLLASPVAMADPDWGAPPGQMKKWSHNDYRHHDQGYRHHYRITKMHNYKHRRNLGDDAVKVLIAGTALWMIGQTYYQWQENQREYVPVRVERTGSNDTIYRSPASGPYYEQLPTGARAVNIGGTQYFTAHGDFYLPVERHGRQLYVEAQP